MMAATARRGFTLIEVLVALTLLALVITLVQGTYSGALRSKERIGKDTERVHLASVVLYRMVRELSMAYESAGRRQATGLVVTTDPDGTSSLSFTTRIPPIGGRSAGGDAEVGYSLGEVDQGVELLRRETTRVDGDLLEGGEPRTLVAGLSAFRVRCYDGEEWREDWDSRDRADLPHLPLAVSLELVWTDGEGETATETVYRTSTPVYAAQR
jgi:general secretion pathway protein J